MNPNPGERPSDAPPPDAAVQARLAHLFRLSLLQGRIHPLYLPLQRYRQGRTVAE